MREHSRLELARKLRPHADPDAEGADLESLLDALTQAGWLSDDRFAESLVRRRGTRYGVLRVAFELGQHGLTPEIKEQALTKARSGELEHARKTWQRRFGSPAVDARAKAAQLRFLQQRGFSAEVIRQVLRESEGAPEEPGDGDD